MYRSLRLAVALALALSAGSLVGAAPTPSSDVLRATLPNGLRVVIVRDTLAPVVTTEMNYLVGSNEAPAGFPGTAHAVEHMMFRGSPGLSKDQLSALAANMGGDFNADTTEGVTQYFFTVPAQDLDVALHIHAIRMRGVDMAPKEWATERGAIEQEVSRDLSDPAFKFISQLRGRLFQGTPYQHTPLGTRPSFDKTTAAALKTFHDTWYAPNNAILVIAGDVDPQAALKEVKAQFGSIPWKPVPRRPSFQLQPVQAHTVKLPTDYPYGFVLISYRTPGLSGQGLRYGAGAVAGAQLRARSALRHGAERQGALRWLREQLPAAERLRLRRGRVPPWRQARRGARRPCRGILQQVRTQGVPADLVAAAKSRAIADLEYKKNSVSGLANAWSQALAFEGASSPDSVKAAIAAVTPAQVDALAKRMFDPAHAITAILTPQSSGNPTSSKGFGGAEHFGGQPSGPVTLPSWAQSAFSKLQVPAPALHPTAFTLPNGLQADRPAGDRSARRSRCSARSRPTRTCRRPKARRASPPCWATCSTSAPPAWTGCSSRRALDAISAHESAGSSFSLAVPVAHFADGMKLLADNELHPAMPAQASRPCNTVRPRRPRASCRLRTSSTASIWTRRCCRPRTRSCATPRPSRSAA